MKTSDASWKRVLWCIAVISFALSRVASVHTVRSPAVAPVISANEAFDNIDFLPEAFAASAAQTTPPPVMAKQVFDCRPDGVL